MCRPYAFFYNCDHYSHTKLRRCLLSLHYRDGAICAPIDPPGLDLEIPAPCQTCGGRGYIAELDAYMAVASGEEVMVVDDGVEATAEEDEFRAEETLLAEDMEMEVDGAEGEGEGESEGEDGDGDVGMAEAGEGISTLPGVLHRTIANRNSRDYGPGEPATTDEGPSDDSDEGENEEETLDPRAAGSESAPASGCLTLPANVLALFGRVTRGREALVEVLRGELRLQAPEFAAVIDPLLLAYDRENARRRNRGREELDLRALEEEVGVLEMLGRREEGVEAAAEVVGGRRGVGRSMVLADRTKK
ncbi:hypothetical protein MBLNU230_g8590t1 [Neophaeotheca triangularis]